VLHSLGRLIHRRARWFALTWLILVVVGFAAATGSLGTQGLFDRLQTSDAPQVPSESREGQRLLSRTPQEGASVVLLVEGIDPAATAVRSAVGESRTALAALAHVAAVVDPFTPVPGAPAGSPSPFVSTDGRAIMVSVSLDPGLTKGTREATVSTVEGHLRRLGDRLRTGPDVRVTVGGMSQLVDEINRTVANDLRSGEVIALPLSLAVMVLVFGGLLAAGLPMLGAIASIAGALACLLGFSYLIDLEASVPSVVSVLGLGLCIDYGLLLVSRFREEVRRLHEVDGRHIDQAPGEAALEQALEHTLGTAGRTVLFSAVTVAISLAGLLLFRATILRAVGAAGVSVVVVAALVALTLVPALLALAGDRIIRPGITHRLPLIRRVARRLGDVAPAEGAFSRLAQGVQRRPWLTLFACLGVLALAAWPVLRIDLVSSGASILPASSPQRHLFDTLDSRFPATTIAPVRVVSRAEPAQLQEWGRTVASLEGVSAVDAVRSVGTGADRISVLGVRTTGNPDLSAGRDVVDRIRNHRPGYPIWVTGYTAQVHDYLRDIRQRAPLAIGVVVAATFVLLFLMTGSVLVPLKALVMNTISLGASFGVLVWVFQHGNLESLLGFTANGGVDQTIPPLALAFAFGLSMDYEVFLLSRIKETRDALVAGAAPGVVGLVRHRRHADGRQESGNDLAVRYGLQRSGRIITSAALIVVIVFAGFVAGDLLIIKEVGVALAVAVAVDATIVRMLLVPATMTLLGEWNWWAPGPLRRIHDRFGLREE